SDPTLRGAQAGAAQAALAEAINQGGKLAAPAFTLQTNSHQDAIQRSYDAQQSYFSNVSRGLYGLLLILPLMVMGLSAYAVWRERQLIRSLSLIAAVIVFFILLFFVWPLGGDYGWAQTPLDRLSVFTNWLSWRGE